MMRTLWGFVRTGAIALTVMASAGNWAHAQQGETIKVGILHSLSGTMAISETTLNSPLTNPLFSSWRLQG